MRDRDFLLWVADRIVKVYDENPDVDFISKLVSVAEATPPEQETPNTGRYDWDRKKFMVDR